MKFAIIMNLACEWNTDGSFNIFETVVICHMADNTETGEGWGIRVRIPDEAI